MPETKMADERDNAHQPVASSGQDSASQRVASSAESVKRNLLPLVARWRRDARDRAIQNEYATWVALMAEVRR